MTSSMTSQKVNSIRNIIAPAAAAGAAGAAGAFRRPVALRSFHQSTGKPNLATSQLGLKRASQSYGLAESFINDNGS